MEDIIDTGNTVEELKLFLKKKEEAFKNYNLILKPEAYKKIKLTHIGIKFKINS
jgi:hypoxanthine-guanine phosphoribosyltransferase